MHKITYERIRIPLKDYVYVGNQHTNRTIQQWRSERFYNGLTAAQRNFIHSIFSWHLRFDSGQTPEVEFVLTDPKQKTLAYLLFP